MTVFDPVTAGTLLILAASPGEICRMPKATDIKVIPSTEKVELITSRTLAQLQTQETNTINPYGHGSKSVTQGYAQGKISMRGEVTLDYKAIPEYGAVCIWYDTITVKFSIDPTVYIAKEVYKDKCMRKAVTDHEMKHVMADRKVVNKYSQIIGQKLYESLSARGFMAGPIRPEHAQATADQMRRTAEQILETEHQRMQLDRVDMQRAIDSLEEYERVSNLCPDFEITPKMLDAGRR
jgi:hypothetical protein